jgi:hypothetical protein
MRLSKLLAARPTGLGGAITWDEKLESATRRENLFIANPAEPRLPIRDKHIDAFARLMLQAHTDCITFPCLSRWSRKYIIADTSSPNFTRGSLLPKTACQQVDERLGWWMFLAIVGASQGNLAVRSHSCTKRKKLASLREHLLCEWQ